MTIQDLAERWGKSVKEVVSICRSRGVPFIPFQPACLRIDWNLVRFRPDAIEEWEAAQQREFRPASSPEPKPTPAKPRPAGSLLGNWRNP